MKREALNHTKMGRLERKLGVPKYAAVGILELLWNLAATEAPRGDIGKLSSEDIAHALGWEEEPEQLIEALVSTGWLDVANPLTTTLQPVANPLYVNCTVIHDWSDHCMDSVHSKLVRSRQWFANGKTPKFTGLNTSEKEAAIRFYAENKPTRCQPVANPLTTHLEGYCPALPNHTSPYQTIPSPPMGCDETKKPSYPLPKFGVTPLDKMRELYGRTIKPTNEEVWLKAAIEVAKQDISDESMWRSVIPKLETSVQEWIDKGKSEDFIPQPVNWLRGKPWTLTVSNNGNHPPVAPISKFAAAAEEAKRRNKEKNGT